MDKTICYIEEPQQKYRLGTVSNRFGLNNIYSQKNTHVHTTQMVQDLTVSATLIYKSSPETSNRFNLILISIVGIPETNLCL